MNRQWAASITLATLLLAACGASDRSSEPAIDEAQLRSDIRQALEAEGSFRFSLEVDTGAGDSPLAVGRAAGEGFYSFDGPSMSLTTEPVDPAPGAEGSEGYQQRLIGSDVYLYPVSMTKAGDGASLGQRDYWLLRDADQPTEESALSFVEQITRLFEVPEGLQIEEQKSDGQSTTYKGVVEGDDGGVAASESATYTVTTGDQSLPEKMVWTVAGGAVGMSISIAFHDFGARETVEPPEAEDVVTMDQYQRFLDKHTATIPTG
jgi:hypothetical protein